MNSIELTGSDQPAFFRYLSYQYKNKAYQTDVKHHFILVDSDTESYVYPSFGEFHWKEEDETFMIHYKEEGKPIGTLHNPAYFRRLIVSHTDLEKLKQFVHKAVTFKKPSQDHKITVYYSDSKGFWDSANKDIPVQCMDNIYLPKDMKAQVLETFSNFVRPETKDRYIRFGRPYKITYLLTGIPGCGKTSLVKALALHLKKDIYHLNFSKTLTDEPMIELVTSIKKDGILLVEDIDSYFEERKAVDVNISFATVINLLDGALTNCGGLITFITANNPEKLDKALIRPGRVDYILRFDYPCKSEIQQAFNDMTAGEDDFDAFYALIRGIRIPMSAIIDFLFRHPVDYISTVQELVSHVQLLHEIHDHSMEKLYT